MQKITSLADKSLLDAEPFKTAFFVHKLAARERRDRRSTQKEDFSGFRRGVDRRDLEKHDALEAAKAWIAIAFSSSPKGGDVHIDTTQVTDNLLEVFVEFHWVLYVTEERNALAYLFKERKRRGFQTSLGLNVRINTKTPRGTSSADATKRKVTRKGVDDALSKKHASSEPETGPSTKRANTQFLPSGRDVVPPLPVAKPKGTIRRRGEESAGVQPPRCVPNGVQLPLPMGSVDARHLQQEPNIGLEGVQRGISGGTGTSAPEQIEGVVDTVEIPNLSSSTTHGIKTHNEPPLCSSRVVKKPKIRRKKTGGELQQQVAKRRRSNDGTPILAESIEATLSLDSAGVILVSPLVKEQTTSLRASSVPNGSSIQAARSAGTKRSRAQSVPFQKSPTIVSDSRDASSRSRTIATLPSSRAWKSKKRVLPTPAQNHQTPRTPEDLDGVIRTASAEAQMLLGAANEPRIADWVQDDEAKEDSSDDEDETAPHPQVHGKEYASQEVSAGSAGKTASPAGYLFPAPAVVHNLFPRSPLPGYPPIWAQSRQEVCESFDWFRSYQGGVYFIHDMVKGYLLSAFSASRDIFHDRGKVIISHGGGRGAERLHHKGASDVLHASDQLAEDKSVRALLKTMELQRPLVLLIDDKYSLFPLDLSSRGCVYAVLGFYRIAYAWAERQPGSGPEGQVVRYKFAFQWCQEQGDPWWWDQPAFPAHCGTSVLSNLPLLKKNSNEPVPDVKPTVRDNYPKCTSCNMASPQVYEEGWMCLKASCPAFFTLNCQAPPASLSYSNTFMQPISFPYEQIGDIRPPPPPRDSEDGVVTGRHACKGWHCRKCGRLSSRFKWEYWECRNCGNISHVFGGSRSAAEFRHQVQGAHFIQHRHSPQSGIIKSHTQMYNHGRGFSTFVTFKLPLGRGDIHVIFSSPFANQTADEILAKYQEEAVAGDLKFRRWPLRSHKCRGALLTNYFSHNTGEPYHYVAGTDNTVSWDMAPAAVQAARKLINQRMTQALRLYYHFNEVLSAGYMEKQKMAFHSDAERGLGETVASLSLGASAYMHFRLHSQFAQELPEDCSREVLSLYLRHGDVVVMQGAEIQKYYEHTVVPLNFRIAATARFIDNTTP